MENWPDLGFRHLVIHNTDLDEWCKKYDLEVYTGKCMKCDGPMEVNVPFVGEDGIRGMRADVCKCGNTCTPFTMISPALNEL